ncbi:condensation domain-containing protein [Paludibacterium paludis]|uniref:Carrier domain-containing protein n=1 Tax=Paludibacterium paludis TaxID=1225769 RepID=A0A918P487_9NEIS|nr:condensation domain-containing protein [Paludibacterium paludis]GGY18416.1 hypothetical protein GCM10011289_22390 [Paludibacterium paludis]
MSIDHSGVADILPATASQQGMLYQALAGNDPGMYLEQYGFTVRGAVDTERYRAAWQATLDYQPALRTTFHWEGLGKAYQVVHRHLVLPFETADLSGDDPSRQAARLEALRQEKRQAGFAPDRGPLFAVTVIRLGQEHYKVWLTLHHALADGWSLSLILAEVAERYRAPDAPRPAAVPLRHYCDWLARQDSERARQWWRERLTGRGLAGQAPLADPRAGGASVFAEQVLDETDSGRLREGCRRQGVTESTLFCAAWALLMARYLRQEHVVFGCVVSTRPPGIAGIERMLGLLLNVLPVTATIEPDRALADWLQGFQRQLFADRQYDWLPLHEMQDLAGSAAETALFGSLLVWENQPGANMASSGENGLRVEHDEAYERNDYPLMLAGYPERRIRLRLTFREDALPGEAAHSLLRQTAALMTTLAEPGTLTLADLAPCEGVLALPALPGGQDSGLVATDPWQRFTEQARVDPEALQWIQISPPLSLTRGQLLARARALAARLAPRLPADRTAPLALLLWPDSDYASAILASLCLGRPWLALDPRKPPDGLAALLEQHRPAALLTQPALWPDPSRWDGLTLTDLAAPDPDPPPLADRPPPAPDDCAFMVLTSGSTGVPKCVRLPHRALRHRLAWMEQAYPPGPDERMLLKTSPVFVDAVCELLGPLLCGYPVVSPGPEPVLDLAELTRLVSDHAITRLVVTPSVLDGLLALPAEPRPALRLLQVSGERFGAELFGRAARRWPRARILNVYGSAEVMADASVFDAGEDADRRAFNGADVPLGKLLPGIRGMILDECQRPLPPGAIGELYLGGVCLASGYLGDEAATAAKFRHLTHLPGQPRMYATGDLASIGPDGELRCHGRADAQIKINGIRIEPGEIEALLKAQEGVADAAVACHDNERGLRVLTAHIASPDHCADPAALITRLRAALARQLSSALMPRHWQCDAELPRNASGKLDRRALRYRPGAPTRTNLTPPQTDTQRQLAELWRQTLGVDVADIDDSFFDAGGNSIRMTQLCFAIRKQFGVAFPIRAIFEVPSLRQQAQWLDALRAGAKPEDDSHGSGDIGYDLDADAARADAIRPRTVLPETSGRPGAKRLFLSGAQGFINAWLLARLLDDAGARVTCLAPGKHEDQARDWLARHLEGFGLWTPERAARLDAVAGDLGAERFGLDARTWARLADSDVLFHTGVDINFIAPYQQLRATNALAAATMVELAVAGRAKPLHFVGSQSIVDQTHARPDSAPIAEDDPLPHWRGLPNGYLQARWVSDTLMRRAMARGLPGSVIRMTTVSGDTLDHRANPQDMMWQLIKLAVTLGAVPDSPRPIDLVPVDTAVEAAIALARSPASLGHVWHVSNPRRWTWREVGERLRAAGYPLRILSGPEWSKTFRRHAPALSRDPAWQAVLPLIGDTWREYPCFFRLEASRTRQRLEELGSPVPPLEWDTLWKTLRTQIAQGFLPPPPQGEGNRG